MEPEGFQNLGSCCGSVVLVNESTDYIAAVAIVKKSQARMLAACWRRKARQLGPERRGAGFSPAAMRRRRTVLGETRRPSFNNSPAIRG